MRDTFTTWTISMHQHPQHPPELSRGMATALSTWLLFKHAQSESGWLARAAALAHTHVARFSRARLKDEGTASLVFV